MAKNNVQTAEKKLLETNKNLETEIAERKKVERDLIL